jgi:signal transduction histidine kinase
MDGCEEKPSRQILRLIEQVDQEEWVQTKEIQDLGKVVKRLNKKLQAQGINMDKQRLCIETRRRTEAKLRMELVSAHEAVQLHVQSLAQAEARTKGAEGRAQALESLNMGLEQSARLSGDRVRELETALKRMKDTSEAQQTDSKATILDLRQVADADRLAVSNLRAGHGALQRENVKLQEQLGECERQIEVLHGRFDWLGTKVQEAKTGSLGRPEP